MQLILQLPRVMKLHSRGRQFKKVVDNVFQQLLAQKKLINKSASIFQFEQLLFYKFDFRTCDFEDAVQLQIEDISKMLNWSVNFVPKAAEKC